MTIDAKRSAEEFLKVFRDNIAEVEKKLATDPIGHVLVNHDASLAIIQTTDGDTYRFGGVSSNMVQTFLEYDSALATAKAWNKRLSQEQKNAGCVVRVVEYADALSAYAATMRDLVTTIEAKMNE